MSNIAAPERRSIDTARAAWSSQRHDENTSRREAVQAITRSGVTTLGAIARALEAQGVKTPSGATKWHRAQVSRLLAGDAAPVPPERLAKVNIPPVVDDAANTTAPIDVVGIEITADHVFLPTGEDGNVGPGWESAGETERVKQGRRLMVPRSMVDSALQRARCWPRSSIPSASLQAGA